MSKIKSGILGYFKGNISSTRGAKVGGKPVIKERIIKPPSDQTSRQILAAQKLGTLSYILQVFNSYEISIYFHNSKKKLPAYSRFISVNYNIIDDDLFINYMELKVSNGNYSPFLITAAFYNSIDKKILLVPNEKYNKQVGKSNDEIDILVFSKTNNTITYEPNRVNRGTTLGFTLINQFSPNQTVFIYSIARKKGTNQFSISSVIKLIIPA